MPRQRCRVLVSIVYAASAAALLGGGAVLRGQATATKPAAKPAAARTSEVTDEQVLEAIRKGANFSAEREEGGQLGDGGI